MGGDHNSTTSTTKEVTELPANLTDVNIYTAYSVKMTAKITFAKDHSYESLAANIHLNDGTTMKDSLVKNWNDIIAGETYSFDTFISIGYTGDHTLSDVKDIDFLVDKKVIYTWKNE